MPSDSPPAAAPADPVRRWTLGVLAALVALSAWSILADRLTPYTSNASMRVFVVRIAPEVVGKVIEVNVEKNQRVRAGEVLFRVDDTTLQCSRR